MKRLPSAEISRPSTTGADPVGPSLEDPPFRNVTEENSGRKACIGCFAPIFLSALRERKREEKNRPLRAGSQDSGCDSSAGQKGGPVSGTLCLLCFRKMRPMGGRRNARDGSSGFMASGELPRSFFLFSARRRRRRSRSSSPRRSSFLRRSSCPGSGWLFEAPAPGPARPGPAGQDPKRSFPPPQPSPRASPISRTSRAANQATAHCQNTTPRAQPRPSSRRMEATAATQGV